jgi:hypothetical protein
MSSLASGYITLEKLEEIVKTLKAKQQKGFNFTVSISDESREFDGSDGKKSYQNVSLYAEQTKEQREKKANKYYFANGGVFWTDGKIVKAGPPHQQSSNASPAPQTSASTADNLPF